MDLHAFAQNASLLIKCDGTIPLSSFNVYQVLSFIQTCDFDFDSDLEIPRDVALSLPILVLPILGSDIYSDDDRILSGSGYLTASELGLVSDLSLWAEGFCLLQTCINNLPHLMETKSCKKQFITDRQATI